MVVSRVLCKRLVFFLADRPSGSLNRISSRIVFPPEPPSQDIPDPERRTAGKGAGFLRGAAKPLPASTVLALASFLHGGGAGTDPHRDSRWWARSESGCFAEGSFDPIPPQQFKLVQRLLPLLHQIPFGADILQR
jgi:hypothetical protein